MSNDYESTLYTLTSIVMCGQLNITPRSFKETFDIKSAFYVEQLKNETSLDNNSYTGLEKATKNFLVDHNISVAKIINLIDNLSFEECCLINSYFRQLIDAAPMASSYVSYIEAINAALDRADSKTN